MGCLSSKAGRHAKETKEKDGNDARVEVATPASPKKKGEKAAVAAKDVEVHVEGAAAPGKGGEAREDDFDPELLSEVENAVAKVMERKTAATSTGGSAPTAASAPAPARTARVPSPTKALNLALTFGEGVSVVPTKDPAHAALELDAATRRKSSTGVAADVAWSDGLVLYSTSWCVEGALFTLHPAQARSLTPDAPHCSPPQPPVRRPLSYAITFSV